MTFLIIFILGILFYNFILTHEEPDSEFDDFSEEDKCHGRIGF